MKAIEWTYILKKDHIVGAEKIALSPIVRDMGWETGEYQFFWFLPTGFPVPEPVSYISRKPAEYVPCVSARFLKPGEYVMLRGRDRKVFYGRITKDTSEALEVTAVPEIYF